MRQKELFPFRSQEKKRRYISLVTSTGIDSAILIIGALVLNM
jgi:hypothetical protein